MTLPVNDRRVGPLTGGPNFPFDFKVFASTDIAVVKTSAAGIESTLVLNSDYTVTLNPDQDANPGGTVAYTLTVGDNITILGSLPFAQPTTLPNGGAWYPKTVEDALDRLTMLMQQLGEKVGRAVLLPVATALANISFPSPVAGMFLRGKVDASGFENASLTTSIVSLPLVVSQGGTGGPDAPTARTNLGVAYANQATVDAGVDDASVVTPLKVKTTVDNRRASQALAEAGADNTTLMTPLRVAQELAALGKNQNVLINGDFQINQRLVTTNAADDTYTLDRWIVLNQTAVVTIAQQTDQENGTPFNIRITQPQAAAQRTGIAQIVEAANCKHLRGRAIVAGARVRISNSQAIRYALLEWTGAANTVTSDVVNDWTNGAYTAGNFFLGANLNVLAVGALTPAANTWTDLPALAATPGSNLNNLIFMVWTEAVAAQNVTIDVARAQAVPGVALPAFIPEPVQDTLAKCLRYYQTSFPAGTKPAQGAGAIGALIFAQIVAASTANNGGWFVPYRVTMRARLGISGPTLFNPINANAQVTNVTTATDCTLTSANGETHGFTVFYTSPAASAAGNTLEVHFAADAEL